MKTPKQRALDAARELKRRREAQVILTDPSFPEQAEFILDPSQFVSALCTRRAGKSTGLGYKMLNKARKHPGCIVPYVGLTRESCKNIMWPILTELNKKHNIGAVMTESDLECTIPNKSMVKLFGADQKSFIEKLRGPKYPLTVIDEAQAFKSHIMTLVDDVFTPATGDYLDGQIVLAGTPGPIPRGYFYEVSQGGQGFSTHSWGVYDNPYFPRPHEFVKNLFEKKKWTKQNPTYRREWLGEWVADLDALVYKFDPKKNYAKELPRGENYFYVIGVDLGYSPDPSAFVVGAYHQYSDVLYLIKEYTQEKMTVGDVADRIKYYLKDYPSAKVVMDLGAQGKMIGEEIRQRYQIPVIAAEKSGKSGFIEIFNSELSAGKIKLIEGETTELVDEWSALLWDSEKEQRVEDSAYPNHLADAGLYLHRYCYNYAAQNKPEVVVRGSEREIDLYWEKEAERLEAELRIQKELSLDENMSG
jgi:hypothetical protein